MVRVSTFGDSILDCARYTGRGVHPGGLLVGNDDALFPEFKGRDLASRGPTSLAHRAVDGARIDGLAAQVRAAAAEPDAPVLVTIGGNDLLGGLALDAGPGIPAFRERPDGILRRIPATVLPGNVYDPTFGDDPRNFPPWTRRRRAATWTG